PVRLSGVEVPADANLLLLIGAANRDPELFPDPDTLDIRRPNAREHLSFGAGKVRRRRILCLGAPRGPLAARVPSGQLTRPLPRLRLAPGPQLSFPAYIAFRGPARSRSSGRAQGSGVRD